MTRPTAGSAITKMACRGPVAPARRHLARSRYTNGDTGRTIPAQVIETRIRVLIGAALAAALTAQPAHATFPGATGKLIFSGAVHSQGSTQDLQDGVWTNDGNVGPASLLYLASTTGVVLSSPAFSSDGARIVFDHRNLATDRADGIGLMDADGTNQTLIPNTTEFDRDPSFLPGGRVIFQDELKGLTTIDPDGAHRTLIPNTKAADAEPDVSPDGTKVAFTRNFGDIAVINLNGTGFTQLTHATTAPTSSNQSPDWSPDGTKILFSRLSAGTTADTSTKQRIWMMNANGTGLTQLTTPGEAQNAPFSDSKPTFSPDGSQIAFARSPFAGGDSRIVAKAPLISAAGAEVTEDSVYTVGAPSRNWFDPEWQPVLCQNTSTPPSGTDDADDDDDGLCDNWEKTGIDANFDGVVDTQLPGANPNRKDLYVELDYMAQHKPRADAIADVVAAFAAAPVDNPDGSRGVNLHVQVDESLPESQQLAFPPCTPAASGGAADFDTLKKAHFGTVAERGQSPNVLKAKRLAYRYNVWAHLLFGQGTTSGCAELPGNDFIVSLGGFSPATPGGHGIGTKTQQEGTFMHELGHTLGLHHGGDDDINCKPNYISIMSYTRQMGSRVPSRALDYSTRALPTLDERHLNENTGIQGSILFETAFGPSNPMVVTHGSGAIDWNQDRAIDGDVHADINNNQGSCDGAGQVLAGFDDWPSLVYDFKASPDFNDGDHATADSSVKEQTLQQVAAMTPDTDHDGVHDYLDNCVNVANQDQVDGDKDGLGAACDANDPKRPVSGGVTCRDRIAPRVTLSKRGVKKSRKALTIKGRATDTTGCPKLAGRVHRVDVAVARKSGKKCRFLSAKGKVGRRRSCAKPVFLHAKGTTSWSLKLKRRPARGSYAISARATDAAANVGATSKLAKRL